MYFINMLLDCTDLLFQMVYIVLSDDSDEHINKTDNVYCLYVPNTQKERSA